MRIVLTVIDGPHTGREFVFEQHDNFIVGRARFARFRLSAKDEYISRVHFLVEVNPPQCRLMDMGSTNGTRVNNAKVQSIDLNNGDLIGVGKTVIRVSMDTAETHPEADLNFVGEPAPRDAGGESESLAHSRVPTPEETGSFHAADRCPSCGSAMSGRPIVENRSACASLAVFCQGCQEQSGRLAQSIGGYRLIRKLGHGAMGVVYLAVREADGGLLAVKTIRPAVAGSAVQIERFLREARILEQLDHPHIVAFRAMDEERGSFYFAMDFVQGSDAGNLQKTLGGPLPIARAVRLACQVLEGLEYAHSRGFVHRDVKPANILVEDREGRDLARLADFGLARTYQASRMSGLTISGDLGGTMAYIAPEQITHFREVKPPADQYAAAASLYRLLTDTPVHDLPRQHAQQILKILQNEPVPIRDRRPDLLPELASVIHRALAREPADRFSDVAAFRAALEPFSR